MALLIGIVCLLVGFVAGLIVMPIALLATLFNGLDKNLMAVSSADTPQIPAASLPTRSGALGPSPAWVDLVNTAHEKAHNSIGARRDVMHKAGSGIPQKGYVDANGQRPGQSSSDQQAFVSVPRPPDTQSY